MTSQLFFSEQDVFDKLSTVIDPELNIDIVSLGLIYQVKVFEVKNKPSVFIKMTLTTPGCPLAGVFQTMIRDHLVGLPDLDVDQSVDIELTFDPPWTIDMMSDEARAELGFD